MPAYPLPLKWTVNLGVHVVISQLDNFPDFKQASTTYQWPHRRVGEFMTSLVVTTVFSLPESPSYTDKTEIERVCWHYFTFNWLDEKSTMGRVWSANYFETTTSDYRRENKDWSYTLTSSWHNNSNASRMIKTGNTRLEDKKTTRYKYNFIIR